MKRLIAARPSQRGAAQVGEVEDGVLGEDPVQAIPRAVVDGVAVAAGELVQLESIGQVHGPPRSRIGAGAVTAATNHPPGGDDRGRADDGQSGRHDRRRHHERAAGMALRRSKRDEPEPRRFQMREKLIAIGDDYWIEDDGGHRRSGRRQGGPHPRHWMLEDAEGREVATIRERKLTIRDAIKIEVGGREATVKKAMVGIRDRFHVEVDGGKDLKVQGNIVDHEYEIERDGDKIAEVSKKWFRVRDTYGVEVRDPLDSRSCSPSPSPSTPSPTTDGAIALHRGVLIIPAGPPVGCARRDGWRAG